MLIYLLSVSLQRDGEKMSCIKNCQLGCNIADNLRIGHIGFVCEDDLTIASDPDGRRVVWVDHLATIFPEAEMQIENSNKMFYAILRRSKTAFRINLTDLIDESEVFELGENIHPAYLDITRSHHHPKSRP